MQPRFFKKYKTEIIICLIFSLCAVFLNKYQVVSDGRVYYRVLEEKIFNNLNPVPLKSIYVDKGGFHQFGTAFFWAPFYAVSLLLTSFTSLTGEPFVIGEKLVTIHTVFINLAANFYTLLTLILSLRILRLFNLKMNKIYVILAVFISTPLLVYSTSLSSFNHAVDAFILTLFVYLFLIWKDKKPSFQFFLGALIAVSVFVRYLNIGIFVFLMFYYLLQKKIRFTRFLFLGFISIIWLLPVSLWFVNGSVFGPLKIILGESNFQSGAFAFLPRYTLKLLLHPMHGLFVWSPITILSFHGLIYYYREDRRTSLFFIGILGSLLLLQGCFYNWHAGWSFSQRYLTGMFPVFVFGFGYYLNKFRRRGLIIGTIFTLYTLFLLMNWGSVINGEFGTPIDMVQAWSSGKVNLSLFLDRINNDILLFLK